MNQRLRKIMMVFLVCLLVTGNIRMTRVAAMDEAADYRETITIVLPGSSYIPADDSYSHNSHTSSGTLTPDVIWGSGKNLTGLEQTIYSKLADFILAVSAGSRTSTEFAIPVEELGIQLSYTAEELGVESIVVGSSISQDAIKAMRAKMAYDFKKIINMLLADLPFDLYWYDKTASTSQGGYSLGASYDRELQEYVLYFSGSIEFRFPVAGEYAAGTYTVDTSSQALIQEVKEKANEIVAKYADVSDYLKLDGYRQEICDLVSYNNDALQAGTPYGNPWQLIWVFDDDPATNVVCEGYSKAFQYLCDLTTFQNEKTRCIIVNGTMTGGTGSGGHMWNVVRLADGNNYLVDITNCDEGTIGYARELFLNNQAEGSVDDGYTFNLEYGSITYTYGDGSRMIYSDNDLRIDVLELTVSHSCTFGNNLAVNYYLPKSALEGYTNIWVEVNKQVYNSDGTEDVVRYEIRDLRSATSGGVQYYRGEFNNIASYEIGNGLVALVHAEKDGVEYTSAPDVYSVKQYAMNRLEKSDKELFKTLCVDLLNYGAQAQVYFNYNASDLVNADLTEEQKALGTPETPELVSRENKIVLEGATASFKAKSVVFNSNTEIKYYMTFNEGQSTENVKLKITYTDLYGTLKETEIPFSAFVYSNSQQAYTATITTIAAYDVRAVVTAAVYDGDTAISDTVEYSIETYCYNRLLKSTSETFKALVSETMKYGISAETYFKSQLN